MTPFDLVEQLGGQVSTVHLAYLVRRHAISEPIWYSAQDEWNSSLFDSAHLTEVKRVLGRETGEPSSSLNQQHCRDEERRYSEGCRARLIVGKKLDKDALNKRFPSRTLTDLHVPQPPLHQRVWRYLTAFELYRIRLTGSELLRLRALEGIVGISAGAWLVKAVGPRIRKFDDESLFDRALRAYIKHYEHLGWGQFGADVALVDALLEMDPSFCGMPVRNGIEHLTAIENEYEELADEVVAFVREVDPENLIMRKLISDRLSEPYREILQHADKRARRSLWRVLPRESELRSIAAKALARMGSGV